MNKTQIEWVKNPDGTQGYTWNPITGCLNGCPYCYARKLANGRCRHLYLANDNLSIKKTGQLYYDECWATREQDPFFPRFWPERLDERRPPVAREQSYVRYGFPCSETFAYRKFNYKPKGIFVCDMGDLFGIGIPEEWTRKVLGVIKCNPADRFYLLTKQPQNLAKFSPFPDNCWVGVTICNQAMANTSIPTLMNIPAEGKKYISIEPMLGPVDLTKIEFGRYMPDDKPYYVNALEDRYILGDEGDIELQKLDQVIIGAQTKPTRYPPIEAVEEIVRACDKAGVAVFLKDNLKPLLIHKGLQRAMYWRDLRKDGGLESLHTELRQELPK